MLSHQLAVECDLADLQVRPRGFRWARCGKEGLPRWAKTRRCTPVSELHVFLPPASTTSGLTSTRIGCKCDCSCSSSDPTRASLSSSPPPSTSTCPPAAASSTSTCPPLGSTAAIIVVAASAQVAHPILWLPQKKTEWNIVVRIVAAIGHSHHQCPNVWVLSDLAFLAVCEAR